MSNANKNSQEICQNHNYQGVCPICGSEQLSYGAAVFDDYGVNYPYVCENCGTKGNEAYNLKFDGHYGINLYNILEENQMNEIFVKFTVRVSNEDIDDIVCTALEGGINYWCCDAEVEGEYLGEYASDQISRGGILKLYDSEIDDVWSLDKAKLLNGISLAITNGFLLEYEWAKFENEIITLDTCQIDAEVADAIIQYALFGKLVFG